MELSFPSNIITPSLYPDVPTSDSSFTKRKQLVSGELETDHSPSKFLKEECGTVSDRTSAVVDNPTCAFPDYPPQNCTLAFTPEPSQLISLPVAFDRRAVSNPQSNFPPVNTHPYNTMTDHNNNNCDPSNPVYDEHEQRAAEDIVRKLCKNGKLMEFQEGEDFIKVIVYEDSQEDEETQSADEEETKSTSYGRKKTLGGRGQSRNLLDCLTDSGKENKTSMPNGPSTSLVQPVMGNTAHGTFPNSRSGNITNMPVSAAPLLNNQMYNTPHPRNGYMFYSESPAMTSMSTPAQARNTGATSSCSVKKTPGSKLLQLNSSGEEIGLSDPLSTPSSEQIHNRVRSLMHLPQFQEEETGKIREQHNQKERRRRARIKEACNLLRQLVPGMSDKTDKATVFEFAARYVHFLKSHTGAQYDKDFLMKYSPY